MNTITCKRLKAALVSVTFVFALSVAQSDAARIKDIASLSGVRTNHAYPVDAEGRFGV